MINEESSKTRYAESFRTLRTNIDFSLVDEGYKSLLVTSSGAGEGKTNTVTNLAYIMAQAGRNVLMVDCDLRRPSLTETFKAKGSDGITGLVVNMLNRPLAELSQRRHSLFDILRLVSFQKKTGCLLVQENLEQVELYFINGRLQDLNWSSRPAEKKLAAVLVENRLLTVEQIDFALKRQKDTGNRLGSTIAKMGFLADAELRSILNMHIMEALLKTIEMQDASSTFSACQAEEINTSTAELANLDELLRQAVLGHEKLPLIDTFIRETVLRLDENLSLMPTGAIPPNPSELLASNRLRFLFDRLQTMYDVLVIDSPPILPASDALILAPKTDGVILVIKVGLLNRDMIDRAVEQLRSSKANILGVVLNQVDTKREGYYKYYYKYYSKYYGEEE